ncbi:hypothetical protein CKW46_12985 [Mycobacterium liflandii]|nr:hypothetical protein CKW46_12985 [Mycobacterium liflandii]
MGDLPGSVSTAKEHDVYAEHYALVHRMSANAGGSQLFDTSGRWRRQRSPQRAAGAPELQENR